MSSLKQVTVQILLLLTIFSLFTLDVIGGDCKATDEENEISREDCPAQTEPLVCHLQTDPLSCKWDPESEYTTALENQQKAFIKAAKSWGDKFTYHSDTKKVTVSKDAETKDVFDHVVTKTPKKKRFKFAHEEDESVYKHRGSSYYQQITGDEKTIQIIPDSTAENGYKILRGPTVEGANEAKRLQQLRVFGKYMLYHDSQYVDMQCALHTLNNVFRGKYFTKETMRDLAGKEWTKEYKDLRPAPLHDHMYHYLHRWFGDNKDKFWNLKKGRAWAWNFGWHPLALGAAVRSMGFMTYALSGHHLSNEELYDNERNDVIGFYVREPYRVGGHFQGVAKVAGVWWDVNSVWDWGHMPGAVPCGGENGSWEECKAFLLAEIRRPHPKGKPGVEGTTSVTAVRCPTVDELKEKDGYHWKYLNVIPNKERYEKWCPDLYNDLCASEDEIIRGRPWYEGLGCEGEIVPYYKDDSIRNVNGLHRWPMIALVILMVMICTACICLVGGISFGYLVPQNDDDNYKFHANL